VNSLIAQLAIAVLSALVLRAERIVLVAGGGTKAADAPAREVRLREPFGVEFDPSGRMVIVEMEQGQRVLRVEKDGLARVIAGTGLKGAGGDGEPATQAEFNGIHNLAIAPDGSLYLADTWNCRVRRIDGASGKISTIAGTGEKGYGGDDGPATAAKLGGIYCAALDPAGRQLYLADLHNLRVRRVDLGTGKIHLVAGNGQKGIPSDGADARTSPLSDPRAVAVDRNGNVYVLERGGNALRVVTPGGKIRTVVNASGKKGATGDGGPALAATMNGPKHLCVDGSDNVIIADAENHLVRKYSPRDGRIVRVAGTGRQGGAGLNGPPLECELARPHGVTVHRDGTLYITDTYNHRILRIDP
jgi:sugar lactone lactonase YvrE